MLKKLGFGPERLRELFPRLICCSISGFGERGPYASRPAYDAVACALSGISSLMVDPEQPGASGPTIVDNVTGMYAAYGILGALYEREKTNMGRRVEVNMLEAAIQRGRWWVSTLLSCLTENARFPIGLRRRWESTQRNFWGRKRGKIDLHVRAPR